MKGHSHPQRTWLPLAAWATVVGIAGYANPGTLFVSIPLGIILSVVEIRGK
jgi:hypothetical protein